MLRMTASTTEMGGFISGGTPFFGAISNHAFALMTNGTERARIHAGGGMTINSTAAKATLYVAGNLQVSNTSVSTTTFSSVSSGNAEVALSWVAVSTGFSLPFMINVEVYAVNTSDPSGGSRIYQKDLILYTVNNGNTQTSSVVNITSNSTGSPVTVTTSVQSPGTNGLTVRVAFSGGCNAIIVVTPSAQQLTVV